MQIASWVRPPLLTPMLLKLASQCSSLLKGAYGVMFKVSRLAHNSALWISHRNVKFAQNVFVYSFSYSGFGRGQCGLLPEFYYQYYRECQHTRQR